MVLVTKTLISQHSSRGFQRNRHTAVSQSAELLPKQRTLRDGHCAVRL